MYVFHQQPSWDELLPRWLGPFDILEQVTTDWTFLHTNSVHPPFHVGMLSCALTMAHFARKPLYQTGGLLV